MVARKKAARLAKLAAQAAEGTSYVLPINKMPFDSLYTDIYVLHRLYLTQPWALLIGPHQARYTVLEGILSKYPQLMQSESAGWTIELPEVCEDAGHTLVHYLYTGTYETLQSQDSEDKTAECRRNTHLYAIATKYDLAGLRMAARQNIQSTQGGVAIIDVLNIAKDVFQILLETDVWFTLYVKTEVEAALKVDESLFAKTRFLELIGEVKSFDRSLMEIVGEIYINNIAITARLSADSRGDLTSSGLGKLVALEKPAVCDEPPPCEEVPGETAPCEVAPCEEVPCEAAPCALPCEEVPYKEETKKGKKKGKKGKRESPERESKTEPITVPVPEPCPPEEVYVECCNNPDIQDSVLCASRGEHLLNGDTWTRCDKCRTMVHQLSIQLARNVTINEDEYEVVDRVMTY
jgi:hypothetical protein